MTTIKTQIVFPEDILKEIDQEVQKRERSEFVVQAVREKLHKLHLQRMLHQAAGLWKDHPGLLKDSNVRTYLKRLRGADTRRRRKMEKARHG